MISNASTSSFIKLDSFAADQAFVSINVKAESSSFFSARLSIFLQAASKVGELSISFNFSSAVLRASMLSDALSYDCTAAIQTFPSLAISVDQLIDQKLYYTEIRRSTRKDDKKGYL